jgi:hypothetical protein
MIAAIAERHREVRHTPRLRPSHTRTYPIRILATCAALSLLVLAPASATATDRKTLITILRDCDDGRLTGTYRLTDIRAALKAIPADTDQYKDCRTVLSRQLAAAYRAEAPMAATSPSEAPIQPGELVAGAEKELTRPANPDEQHAIDALTTAPPPRATASGLTPATHVSPRNPLPTSLVATLGLLAIALLLAALRLRPGR